MGLADRRLHIVRDDAHLRRDKIEFKNNYGKKTVEVGKGVRGKIAKGSGFHERRAKEAYRSFTGDDSRKGANDFVRKLKDAETTGKDVIEFNSSLIKPAMPVAEKTDKGISREKGGWQGFFSGLMQKRKERREMRGNNNSNLPADGSVADDYESDSEGKTGTFDR